MSSAIIISKLEAVELTVSTEIRAQVDAILRDCRDIATITDPLDADSALHAQKAASQLAKAIQSQRREITRPLDELKARIMAHEEDLTGNLLLEAGRLAKLNAQYEMERRRAAEEAKRKAEEERRRIEAEAAAKALAEAERIRQEAAEAAAGASAQEAAAIAEEARRQADAAAAQARAEADARAREAHVQAALSVPEKPTGARMVKVYSYTVTDLRAALEFRPEWFEIKPKDGLIKQALRSVPEGTAIPGIEWTVENKLSV